MATQRSGGISWTDVTWSPIRGCSRVSEGCRHCYAEAIAARFSGPGQPYEGLARMTPDGPRWSGEVRLIEEHLSDPLRWKRPRRVFVNSMSDLFHELLPDEAIDRVFVTMALTPRHIFQILTKRPQRMLKYCGSSATVHRLMLLVRDLTIGISGAKATWEMKDDGLRGICLPNVWLGVSVENQPTADERIPLLLQTPAAVRFISYEPVLGPVDIDQWLPNQCVDFPGQTYNRGPSLDWVIAGSESGPNARHANPDWYRAVRDACFSAGVAFHLKQHVVNGKKIHLPELDGKVWAEFPEVTNA